MPVLFEDQPEALENFDDANHGYLRISVTPNQIQIDYIAVPDPSTGFQHKVLDPSDSVTVHLP
jgi:hypothetical protein